ncbi:hypothetical protein [uncultured Gammaproteobacteria bacterium]|nr:hypothetical protein [uncultured Gammaproteobacteria bacterium]VVH60418.1 hypothetical protein BAZOLSSOX_230 [uncultured Gammaproteobacteria bacterium]
MTICTDLEVHSPPHRWLRNLKIRFFHCGEYSPPHRWLRK